LTLYAAQTIREITFESHWLEGEHPKIGSIARPGRRESPTPKSQFSLTS
jgi:hypothetical protein